MSNIAKYKQTPTIIEMTSSFVSEVQKTKTKTGTNPSPDRNRYRRHYPDPNARIQKIEEN